MKSRRCPSVWLGSGTDMSSCTRYSVQAVDKMWKSVMLATDKDPLVLSCVGEGKTYLADFQMANQLLEEIQKSLEEYLETKRMAFPRYSGINEERATQSTVGMPSYM